MAADASGVVVAVRMPRLSDSMEEATVLAWLKRPGERIERGEPLVEIETDKATVVYEAETSGVLEAIVVDEGVTASLGETIATLRALAEASPAGPSRPAPPSTSTPADRRAALQPVPPAPRTAGQRRPPATPVARRLAGELGVALGSVQGTGPGGRVVGSDVRAAAGGGPDEPVQSPGRGTVTKVAHTATQRTIAQRMSESRSSIPDFTVECEIAMEAAARLREDLRAGGHDPAPSYNDLIVRACALALREFPGLNAGFGDGGSVRFGRVNVGIAVATEDVLLVPTVFDADRKSVFEIAAETRRLVERTRARALAGDDLAHGTFTVSNLGMFGVRRFHAVINHPQAAILSVGEVARRPVATDDGEVTAQLTVEVALSCDHRVVYGADAARFLQKLRLLLEHPTLLIVR